MKIIVRMIVDFAEGSRGAGICGGGSREGGGGDGGCGCSSGGGIGARGKSLLNTITIVRIAVAKPLLWVLLVTDIMN